MGASGSIGGFLQSHHNHAAVIVEPRKHALLSYTLANFHAQLPLHYDMYVFHGKSANKFARAAAAFIVRERTRKIRFRALDTDNLTAEQYNAMFRQSQFWAKVPAEHILVFQTDAAVCGEEEASSSTSTASANIPPSLAEFEDFGYIGCSFRPDCVGSCTPHFWHKQVFYGVGGLSLRKKSFMMECIKQIHEQLPEDVFFSKGLHVLPAAGRWKVPTGPDVQRFCAQHSIQNRSWGVHKPDRHLWPKAVAMCPAIQPWVDSHKK
jgi:hypothetical protein